MSSTYTNLVERLIPAIKQGWYVTNEGKFKRHESSPMVETPWIYHNMTFQCVKWHYLFFDCVANKKMVHSHCQQCWKVVISPRTVEELVELERWQARSGLECKCGIELRDFVRHKRIYGGYFYNPSVEVGRETYRRVKEWAEFLYQKMQYEPESFVGEYESPMQVILKRGCTEFERANYPSSEWKVTEEQERIEAAFDEMLDFDPYETPEGHDKFPQPEILKQYVRLMWLKWAHHHGDMTYVKYLPDGEEFDMEQNYFTKQPAFYHDIGEEG